jgi:hypothetical protein
MPQVRTLDLLHSDGQMLIAPALAEGVIGFERSGLRLLYSAAPVVRESKSEHSSAPLGDSHSGLA